MITVLLITGAGMLGWTVGWTAARVTAGRRPLTSDQLRAQTKDWP